MEAKLDAGQQTAENSKQPTRSNRSHALKRVIGYTLAVILFLYLFIWIFSPALVRQILSKTLEDQYGLVLANDSSVRYNPFTTHLTINNLAIHKDGVPVLSIKRLDLGAHLYQLLTNTLYLSEFEVTGVYVAIEQHGEEFIVSGVNLSRSQSNNNPEPTDEASTQTTIEQKVTAETDAQDKSYLLMQQQALLTDLKLSVNLNGHIHEFKASRIKLSDLALSQDKQYANVKIDGSLDKGEFSFNSLLNLQKNTGTINNRLQFNQYPLQNLNHFLPDGVSDLSGFFSLDLSNNIKLANNQALIEFPDVSVNIDQFSLNALGSSAKFNKAELKGNEIKLSSRAPEQTNLNISQISFQSEQLSLDSDHQSFENNSIVINFEKFLFEDQSLQLENLNAVLGESTFTLKRLLEESPQSVRAVADSDTSLENSNASSNSSSSASANTGERANATPSSEVQNNQNNQNSDAAMNLALEHFNFKTDGAINFVDENTKPAYKRSIQINELSLGSINSSTPNEPSPILLDAKSDQFSLIKISGQLKPFTEKTNLALQGSVTEIALPPASTYIQNLLGFAMKSGELDTDIAIKVKDSIIDGNTKIHIRGLEMANADSQQDNLLTEQTAMPLNVALGMLTDDNGNLELDVPLSGDVESPSFGMASFVSVITKKAITAAAKNYLVSTFIPYAEVVSLTFSAGELLMKLRFEDLIYAPGQIEISNEQLEYMQQFVSLIKDKPDSQIKACPIAGLGEIPGVDGKPNEEQERQLLDLAEKRGLAFEAYAVSKGLESSKILLCAPKIDHDKNAAPRIVISV